jgi:hypothetical protein
MTQAHIDRVLSDWAEGCEPDWAAPTVADLGLDPAALLALPECFEFDAPHAYCPASDVPEWGASVGVHVREARAAIVVDNGQWLTCWLLSLK